jgi:hypothetical protein
VTSRPVLPSGTLGGGGTFAEYLVAESPVADSAACTTGSAASAAAAPADAPRKRRRSTADLSNVVIAESSEWYADRIAR